jgi:triphosphatase
VAFKAKTAIDDTIARVVVNCRDHWQANLPAALDGRDAEGVHQVRVGLRRFRSALSLFKRFLPASQRDWLNTEAKWLADQLGPVRDLDVFIADVKARADKGAQDAALDPLMHAAKIAHHNAQAAAITALRSPRMRRFMARLDTWIEGRGWYADTDDAPDAAAFAREALNKRLRKIRAVAARAETLSVAERHALRIAVKKLRYGIEFMTPALPEKRVARTQTVLKQLQDSLGHLNDLDVAERTITLISTDAPEQSRRRIKKTGHALKAAIKKAAAKAEPETTRLCAKLVRLPGF